MEMWKKNVSGFFFWTRCSFCVCYFWPESGMKWVTGSAITDRICPVISKSYRPVKKSEVVYLFVHLKDINRCQNLKCTGVDWLPGTCQLDLLVCWPGGPLILLCQMSKEEIDCYINFCFCADWSIAGPPRAPFDHIWAMVWSGARGNIAITVL